jgi:hypothetical protein
LPAWIYPHLTRILQTISDDQYADDLNAGADTLSDVVDTFRVMEETTRKASMPLGKYKFDPPEISCTFGLDPSYKPYRILGCGFDPTTSSFYVPLTNFFEYLNKPCLSKRHAWGAVARFCDSLGILAGCL